MELSVNLDDRVIINFEKNLRPILQIIRHMVWVPRISTCSIYGLVAYQQALVLLDIPGDPASFDLVPMR
jgi:hypothetical protein